MSRYYDGDYDENFNNEGEFWRANLERAMNGKRGRKALAELREALLNLPDKRLIDGALCTVNPDKRAEDMQLTWSAPSFKAVVEQHGEGVCAVGAYAWWKKVKAGQDPQQAFDELPTLWDGSGSGDEMWQTERVGVANGLTQYVAWELAYTNDETFARCTPEERYERFLAWLDQKLASRRCDVLA